MWLASLKRQCYNWGFEALILVRTTIFILSFEESNEKKVFQLPCNLPLFFFPILINTIRFKTYNFTNASFE